jgi:hypothetical protein
MEIKTSEFFRNMKTLPPPGTEEFRQLIKWEEDKIKGGVNINGVYISGWLYWHLNHWWIRVDDIDVHGNDIRVVQRPDLRDNEWIRADVLEKCKLSKQGYIEVGARQGGKSEMEASYFGMNATLFENTQNLIVCGNDYDLGLLKDKVDFGLKSLWTGIGIPRLDKTWRSNQIRLGYKKPDGEDAVWSYIVIRNASDGNTTEVAAGTTAKSLIMDEIGKYLFASAFKAGEPAIKGKNGWRAVPIFVGTGGSFEKGQDAENFFYHPESNNFYAIDDPNTGKKTGLFLSGIYRQDCKRLVTLDVFLKEEYGIVPKNINELKKIEIQVSDKLKALEVIEKERERAKRNPDRTIYLKQVMYYPLTVDECFLSDSENDFDIEGAKRQKQKLQSTGYTGTPVILYDDGEGVKHQFTDKKPISSFPVKKEDNKDAPVVIHEFPIEDPPYGLYVAGVDPYRQGKAEYSKSLGAVYIYKRMHTITGEKYQDMFVASYVARPDRKDVWEEQARLLIKYYNARTLVENDEISFIDYMIGKGDSRYLERQPIWLQEIVPNTTVHRDFGIHRSAEKIRLFLHGCLKKYSEEILITEKDDAGNVISVTKGMTKIFDPMLLEEMIKYNDVDNFDRVVAAELAIALAMKMDPMMGAAGADKDIRVKTLYDKNRNKSTLFTQNNALFSNNNKLFK